MCAQQSQQSATKSARRCAASRFPRQVKGYFAELSRAMGVPDVQKARPPWRRFGRARAQDVRRPEPRPSRRTASRPSAAGCAVPVPMDRRRPPAAQAARLRSSPCSSRAARPARPHPAEDLATRTATLPAALRRVAMRAPLSLARARAPCGVHSARFLGRRAASARGSSKRRGPVGTARGPGLLGRSSRAPGAPADDLPRPHLAPPMHRGPRPPIEGPSRIAAGRLPEAQARVKACRGQACLRPV